MATAAEKRAWLRDNTTEDIPDRGRIRPDLDKLYDDAHPLNPGDWDVEDGGDDLATAMDTEPDVPMEPEGRPATPRAARQARRARPRTGRLLGKLLGDDGKTKAKAGAKRKVPRISLENFTARAYSTLGRMVRPISPATGNCLQAQAAMAGVLLEDVAQGTIIDRFLQGPARAEDKLDKGFALVAPPLLVFAIEANQAAVQAGAKTPQQGMVRHAMLMPVLRESLRIGLEVSEGFADQIKARLEREQEFDGQIDELISLIVGQVTAEAEEVPDPEMAGV